MDIQLKNITNLLCCYGQIIKCTWKNENAISIYLIFHVYILRNHNIVFLINTSERPFEEKRAFTTLILYQHFFFLLLQWWLKLKIGVTGNIFHFCICWLSSLVFLSHCRYVGKKRSSHHFLNKSQYGQWAGGTNGTKDTVQFINSRSI